MKVVTSLSSIRTFVKEEKQKWQKIGFVPTMGALHDGHIELVRKSISENNTTIVSIFVNPLQFDKKEDFDNYPSLISEDEKLLTSIGCDVLFLPNSNELYPYKENLSFNFGFLESTMEGKFRVGHFSGVGLIISKLFNLIQPDKAYFGEKDLQQLAVIKKLTSDLNFDTEVIGVPTIRETSGLAMSSRNSRLSEDQKELAVNIYKRLILTKNLLLKGQSTSLSKKQNLEFFSTIQGLDLEYIEIVDTNTLKSIKEIKCDSAEEQKISICIAAFIGNVRLIDNISFTV